MFHVLAGNATIQKAWPESEATKVVCGAATPRCAISQTRFDNLLNSGKLNTPRVCASCYYRVTGTSKNK